MVVRKLPLIGLFSKDLLFTFQCAFLVPLVGTFILYYVVFSLSTYFLNFFLFFIFLLLPLQKGKKIGLVICCFFIKMSFFLLIHILKYVFLWSHFVRSILPNKKLKVNTFSLFFRYFSFSSWSFIIIPYLFCNFKTFLLVIFGIFLTFFLL